MYERFAGFTDGMILAFLDRGIQAGIQTTLGYMRGALMVLVAVAAVLAWTRRLDVWWVARRVLVAMMVIAALRAGAYGQYIREPFWNTIPNTIAGAFTGGAVSISPAQRFDRLSDAAANVVAAADARISFSNVRAQFGVAFAQGLMNLFIGLCFALWLVSRVATALLVAVGPFLLIAFLFDLTRAWGMGWLAKLVTLSVWTVCAMALTEMMLAGSMMWVQQAAANAAGLSERLDGLWKLVIWFLINLGVMAGLPYYASVHSGAAGGVHAGAGVAAGAAGMAAGKTAAALRGATRALNRASRRSDA